MLQAAADAGLRAELAAWDDPGVDWSGYDLAAVRSTWDYYADEGAFRAWIGRAARATRLWNPAELMLANIHKGYLAELAGRGVPIVPTRFLRPGERLAPAVDAWARFVVKPAVSAGSFMTRPFTAGELPEAEVFAAAILARGDAMVQPYVDAVADGGEVALVWVDGEFTHAVAKAPRFHADDERVTPAFPPTNDQLSVARRTLAAIPGPKLYARIDLMRLVDGTWALSEAELIEPSLFFLQHPPALERFMRAIRARIAAR